MLPKRLLQASLALAAAASAAAATVNLMTRQPPPPPELFRRPIRGVNLGGWLVLEPWITPSVFEEAGEAAVDEYTLSRILRDRGAESRLRDHWNTWITQADFQRIAAAGMNSVRIPIGYWAVIQLPGEPYIQGQLEYMDKALGWARNAGLKVIVDLHGAPGSQNGFDNSGRRGPMLWQTGDTVKQTLDALRILIKRYARQTDVVTGIELLNEPNSNVGVQIEPLKQVYYDGWGLTREASPHAGVVISDAFKGVPFWNGFMTSGFNNVFVDAHYYQVFDVNALRQSPDQLVSTTCNYGNNEVARGDKWTFVGEFSGATTDCAKYLNGRGVGTRWEGTHSSQGGGLGSCAGKSVGSMAGLSQADRDNTRKFIEAQLNAFEKGVGWFFWTWKTQGAPGWDMSDLLNTGVFPQPLDSRRFVPSC